MFELYCSDSKSTIACLTFTHIALKLNNLSRCGAAGSALALGACPAVIAVKKQKSRKPFTYADFRGFIKTQKSVDFEFDHSLSHFHAKT